MIINFISWLDIVLFFIILKNRICLILSLRHVILNLLCTLVISLAEDSWTLNKLVNVKELAFTFVIVIIWIIFYRFIFSELWKLIWRYLSSYARCFWESRCTAWRFRNNILCSNSLNIGPLYDTHCVLYRQLCHFWQIHISLVSFHRYWNC